MPEGAAKAFTGAASASGDAASLPGGAALAPSDAAAALEGGADAHGAAVAAPRGAAPVPSVAVAEAASSRPGARAESLLLNAFSTYSQLIMGRIGLQHPDKLGWTRELNAAQQQQVGVRVEFWKTKYWEQRFGEKLRGNPANPNQGGEKRKAKK